jgi:hypothetical protein
VLVESVPLALVLLGQVIRNPPQGRAFAVEVQGRRMAIASTIVLSVLRFMIGVVAGSMVAVGRYQWSRAVKLGRSRVSKQCPSDAHFQSLLTSSPTITSDPQTSPSPFIKSFYKTHLESLLRRITVTGLTDFDRHVNPSCVGSLVRRSVKASNM